MESRKIESSAPQRARGYLTIAHAAEYVGVSQDTVRRRIVDGTLRSYRVAGTRAYRLRVEDVEGLMLPVGVYG